MVGKLLQRNQRKYRIMEKIKKFNIKTFYSDGWVKAGPKYNNIVDELAQGAIRR